jgi:hypothetical protein
MKLALRTKSVATLGTALALTGIGSNALALPEAVAPQAAIIQQKSNVTGGHFQIVPAVARDTGSATSHSQQFQLAHWYNNKHWWKRNAPIIGGAGGGALVGGLAGGGTGAVIGGAAGAGGGYLYKRLRHNHHHPHHE